MRWRCGHSLGVEDDVAPSMSRSFVVRQSQIIGALMMREMATRYGRRGLGFLWVVGEPLMFCFGVILMWTLIRKHNDHGLSVAAFVMTGYMNLLLLRHSISFSLSAVGSNLGLLYHRKLAPLHFYLARSFLELAGGTAAFIIVYLTLIAFRQVDVPHDWLLLYSGWTLMWVMATGTGFIFSGLATRFEVMERVVPLLSYAMIPLSGVFFMVDWLPESVRERYLWVPFPNAIEMVRAGVFGEFVPTHFNFAYAVATALLLLLVGLLLVKNAEGYIDVD
jgi:capsular polysaccharide transport system permease protein